MRTRELRVVLKSFISIVLYVCLLEFQAFAYRQKIILTGESDLTGQLIKENCVYLVRKVYDLKGETLEIPNKCVLNFEGGTIKNGTIIGHNTEIVSDRSNIFVHVSLLGTWSNTVVFSEWLDFVPSEKVDNAVNFRNLMSLCNGEKMTHLYMQSGVYYCSVASAESKEESNIKVPSNVYWHNAATIRQLSTDIRKSSLVLLHKSFNVTIDGGEFVGDVKSHIGNKGEWGHGIKLAGASNVVLRNLISREFWGDGIDLIEADYVSSIAAGVGLCNSITLDNVKCLYNRRQGLSIEAAQNVVIKKSEFAFTGKYGFTEPGCGVDIEPWCNNEVKIKNIRFYDCNIHDNSNKRDFCIEANHKYFDKNTPPGKLPVNRIIVNNCKMGKLYIFAVNTVSFNNCVIEDICLYSYGDRVKMKGCTIRKHSGVKGSKGLTMRRCVK